MNYKKLVSIGSVLLLSQVTTAQTIPLDTAVRTGQLANGFTYYIRHNEQPENRVLMYLVNNVGSVLEDDDQQGLAHFMEHMNFNGTQHFPKNKLVDYLQRAGVRFGADLNAYTSFDETVFELPLPVDNPDLVDTGLEIMHDWAGEATLDSIEIEKERGVVLEERRLGLGASERLQRQYFPVLLNHSRYAERIPIGKENILVHFPPSVIRRFHHDWYRPDLQALIVVGDIDVNKMEAKVKKQFGDLANPDQELPRREYKVPLTGENHFLVATDREMPSTDLQVIIKHPAPALKTEDDYRSAIGRELVNQMLTARYLKLSQETTPPFLRAEAGVGAFMGGLDMFSFDLEAKEGGLQKGFQSAWEIIEQLRRYGFTQTELDRARQNYLGAMEAAFDEKDKTPSLNFVKEYQQLFLHQEASPGIAWEYHFVKNNIGAISLEAVNRIAKEYIGDINRDVLILAPDRARTGLPDSATVAGWMNTVSHENLLPYKEEVTDRPLLSSKPAGGRIISTRQIATLGITELKLSNGMKVILKPTAFKNNEIRFAAFGPGGICLYGKSDYESAANAAGIISSFGVGAFNPVQLNQVLTGKQLEVVPYIKERSEGINGITVPHDLETALQLIYLWFTQPRKDSALFDNIIGRSREVLASRYSAPANVFTDTVNYVLGNYSYRWAAPSIEKLGQIDLQKVFRIYKDRFADASGFTFIMVGSFNADSIRDLLAQYLGALPATHQKEALKDRGIHIPAGKIIKTVYKGTENKATVRLVFSGDYTYNPQDNLLIRALAEVLQIKVLEHLREDESEVYSPTVQADYHKYPRSRYAFVVNFGCAPKNVDNLVAGVSREIDRVKQVGPDPDDVEKFKAEYRRNRELQLQDNRYWIAYIENQVENQEDILAELNSDKVLAKVTPVSLQRAAKKYLSGDNEIKFALLPEK